MIKKKRNSEGFTLVEVLAVVVLIAIVLVFSFNAYNYIIDSSKNKAVKMSRDNIKKAAELYSSDNKDYSGWGKYDVGDHHYSFYCVSIQDLINGGFFGEDLLNKKIKSDGGINNNSLIKIVKDSKNMSIIKTEITTSSNLSECLNNTNPLDDEVVSDNQYHVIFDANGGDVVGTYTFDRGSSITLPITKRMGYLFSGWYSSKFGGKKIGEAGTSITPSYDMRLYAHWLPDPNFKRVTIKLHMNGGSLVSPHGEAVGVDGNFITIDNSTIIHDLVHGASLDSNGLANWNNDKHINLKRDFYTINSDKAWCLNADGSGTCYKQNKDYNSTDFCADVNKNCDITLYANWVPNNIYIQYHVNGGSLNTTKSGTNYRVDNSIVTLSGSKNLHSLKYGDILGENGLFNYQNEGKLWIDRTGYSAVSGKQWCKSPNSDGSDCFNQTGVQYEASRFCDATNGDCSAILYVNWKANSYSISLDNSDATTKGTEVIYVIYESNYYLDEANTKLMSASSNPIVKPSKSGYTFGGFYTASNGGGEQIVNANGYVVNGKTKVFTSDTTLYPKWTANNYTVTYNSKGGSTCSPNSKTVTFGSTYGALCEPSLNGTRFNGWFYPETNGNLINRNTIVNVPNNHTLFASWEANTYSITYYDCGGGSFSGTHISGYPTKYTFGTAVSLDSPTKNGYKFSGYYASSACSGNKVTGVSATDTGTKTYYAKWDANTYTINYSMDGGTKGTNAPTSGTYDSVVTIDNPTKTGFTFSGWMGTNVGSNAKTGNSSNPTTSWTGSSTKNIYFKNLRESGTVTFTALWGAKNYTLTYNSNGGSACSPSTKSVTYGSSYGTLCEPEYNGNAFLGWYTSATGGTNIKSTDTVSITENKTIYAHWNPNSYSITYKDCGNTTFSGTHTSGYPTKYTFGNTVTLDSPSKVGYTFDGYYTTSACSGNKITSISSSATGAKTYYAKWNPNKYTVSLNNEGATDAGTTSIYELYNTAFYIDSAMTIQMHVGSSENPNPITRPTKTGYTFGGYYTAKNGEGDQLITSLGYIRSGKTTTFDSNGTLYANWTAKDYTVNYYLGNADGSSPTKIGSSTCTYKTGCSLSSFSDFGVDFPYSTEDNGGKYGWSFYGWSTSSTGTSIISNSSSYNPSNYNGTVNLYAVGKKNYRFNGGYQPTSFIENGNLYQYWNPYDIGDSYSTSITVPDAISINGWEFVGYIGGSNAANNATVCIPASSTGSYKPAVNVCSSGLIRSKYKRTLSITYDKNSGTGTTATTNKVQYYNSGYASGGSNVGSTLGANAITLASNSFTRAGYKFSKWAEGSASGTKYDAKASYEGIGDTVLNATITKAMFATWDRGVYTISLDNQGAKTAGTTTIYEKYGEGWYFDAATTSAKKLHIDSNSITVPTKDGNTFEGYFTAKNGGGTKIIQKTGFIVASTTSTFTANGTLYASWSPSTATISYKDCGDTAFSGSHSSGYPTSYTYGVGATLDSPTKAGYTFDGYFSASACSGSKVTSVSTTATGNKTFYAKWTAVAPTISFSPAGGSSTSSSVKIRSGTDVVATCTSAAGIESFTATDDKGGETTLSKPSSTSWKRTDTLSKLRDDAYVTATCKSKNGESKTVKKYYDVKAATPSISFSPNGGSSGSPVEITKGSKITIKCSDSFGVKKFTTKDDTGDTGTPSGSTATTRYITLGSVRSSAYIKAVCTADDGESKTVTKYYNVKSSSSGGGSGSYCDKYSGTTKGSCQCFDVKQCHIAGGSWSSVTKKTCCNNCSDYSHNFVFDNGATPACT